MHDFDNGKNKNVETRHRSIGAEEESHHWTTFLTLLVNFMNKQGKRIRVSQFRDDLELA